MLYVLAESLRFIGILIDPVMPSTPEKIFCQLGISDEGIQTWASLDRFGHTPAGQRVMKGEAIFPRIDIKADLPVLEAENEVEHQKSNPKAAEEEKAAKPAVPLIGIEDFQKIQLVTAKVLACEKSKKATSFFNSA